MNVKLFSPNNRYVQVSFLIFIDLICVYNQDDTPVIPENHHTSFHYSSEWVMRIKKSQEKK